jgi:hypothetical protein
MFDNLFNTTEIKPKSNKLFEGLFDNVVSTPTIAPKIKTSTLPDFLGGGAYNTVIGQPNKLATSTRAYAGVATQAGKDRHHIIPVEFGGSSETDKNINQLDEKAHKRITDAEFKISSDYKAGKIDLPEARLKMMTALQTELDAQKGIKQGIFNNLWGGIKQLGSDIKNTLTLDQEELKTEFEKTPQASSKSPNIRLTDTGLLITKTGDKYTALDPTAGVGSLKNVAKEGLDAIGRQLLKNIKGATPEIIAKGKSLLPPLIQEAKKYKSAEEFVKAQPTAEQIGTKEFGADDFRGGKIKLFHQTGADIKSFDKDIPTFFNTKERYQTYGDKTIEAVADIKKPLNMGTEIWIQTEQPSLIAKAKKRGYDAVTFTHYMDNPNVISEVIVIDPKIIKTKSQLTDIWNKANKTDIANQMGFAKMPKVLTNAAESIAPIKNQNPVVQSTFKTWTRELLVAEEKANKQLAKIPKVADNFDTILKYEKGIPTKFTSTIKKEFDTLFRKAKEAGVKIGYKENYIPQVYQNTLEEVKTATAKYMKDNGVVGLELDRYLDGIKELPDIISKRLKLNPFFSKERAFPDYTTAIKYGLTPKYTEPSQLLANYSSELDKTVANRKFLDDLVFKGQVATVERAGESWEALTLPFSPKGYYAPPELAKMLNGMFRNEELLGAGATAIKGVATLSRTMQEAVLSAGVPKTNINFFAIGQLIKNLTAGELKSAVAFIRSNFNKASINFLQDNGEYLEKMANQGIDILKRVDSYDNIYKNLKNTKGITNKIGLFWDKAFGEKTFKSFMPQMQVQTFKDVYTNALKKLPAEQAEKLAGDTVKAFYGLMENVGRGKGTEDFLGATFFAPKFREGIIRTLFNTGKSITTEIFNPAFSKNRKLLAGMILSYAGYNALNKKLTGHYMWENPDGKEFDLQIPTKLGNTQDDVIYIGFMPSFLAFARNMVSGGIALVKGDTSTAKQKLGSVFSMPIKTASELWANKDYFGRKIYEDYDDAKTKLEKMASYAFLSVNHPFIKETYKQMTTDKPLYQSVSEAMELPFKFSSYTKIEQQEFYEAIRKQDAKEAKIKSNFKPRYTEVRDLLEKGKIDEATNIINSMTEEEFKLYESLKRADKTRANVNAEIKVFNQYKEVKELINKGKIDEATTIINSMTDDEYKAYQRLKSKLQ